MKAYILATGSVFALFTVAHAARVLVEGTYVLRETIFVLTTLISVALLIWSIVLFRRSFQSGPTL